MRLYHVRSLRGQPNYEAICTNDYYRGWNDSRSSGALGTGVYCRISPPVITEPARLYVYEIDTTHFFRVTSVTHEHILSDVSKSLMRFVVASLRALYRNASKGPLRAWYDHCDGTVEEYTADLCALSNRLAVYDDALSRFLGEATKDRDWFLFDYIRSYTGYVRRGASLSDCDGRRTPFTFLLIQLGCAGVMYGGDASFLNDRESHGVVVFDTDAEPLSITNVDPGWVSSYRSALLC